MTVKLALVLQVDKHNCSETDKSIEASVRDAVKTTMDTALQEGFDHSLSGEIEITDYEVFLPEIEWVEDQPEIRCLSADGKILKATFVNDKGIRKLWVERLGWVSLKMKPEKTDTVVIDN